jgi:hypothetical protein
MNRADVGVLLVFLGGIVSLLESGLVVWYSVVWFTVGFGAGGLVVAFLVTAGAVILYKSRFKLVGALLVLCSSAVGQLTGGAIGVVLSVFFPQYRPIFNGTFLVSRWTLLALIGSILILCSPRQDVRNVSEENSIIVIILAVCGFVLVYKGVTVTPVCFLVSVGVWIIMAVWIWEVKRTRAKKDVIMIERS